ncbi:MAG: efflux RND transporter periplasmic adaptor subunit [Gammaproteobacteria bacterium]|nr:efflux RND transporter periplasmic adaptor subunit [Gammaproteobacteria bacterium]
MTNDKGQMTLPLFLLVFSIVYSAAHAQSEAVPVEVDAVYRGPMTQTIPVIGRLITPQSGVVAARTMGPVAELPVKAGERMKRGDVLAVLAQDRLRARHALQEAEIKEFQARMKTAAATEKLARQQLKRLEKLRGSAAFTQSLHDSRVRELAVARSIRQEAEARIARGRISLQLAQIELEDSTIRAPFSGVVMVRHTSKGAWLEAGDPVVTLGNDIEAEIEADVPAKYLAGLEPGTQVRLLLDDGSHHKARVRAVIPNENPATRTRPVRLIPEFDNVQIPLAVNQAVTLLIPSGNGSEVNSVHKDAVLRKGDKALVYLVEDGIVREQTVLLGKASGNRFHVLEGLVPGDLAVIRGNERLYPGQAVRYTE